MTAADDLQLPVNWCSDFISQFQQKKFQNELSFFAHANDWHLYFNDLAVLLSDCTQFAVEIIKENPDTSILLLVSSYNNYLACISLSASGHCLPSYPVARAALEFSLYAWYLKNHEDSVVRWHKKPSEYKEIRKWTKEFSFSHINNKLKEIDNALSQWSSYIYETTIDFGAHPNKTALYSNIEIKDNSISINILNGLNDTSFMNIKTIAETGLFLLKIYLMCIPGLDEKYNLADELSTLATRLHVLQSTYDPKTT